MTVEPKTSRQSRPRSVVCLDCGSFERHASRGLCQRCYKQRTEYGTLNELPKVGYAGGPRPRNYYAHQHEIDGALLGDGWISKTGALGFGSNYEDLAEFVAERLVGERGAVRKNNRNFFTFSEASPRWKNERKRWYDGQGTKRIPDDLQLTKKGVLLWYLGDGGLYQEERTRLCPSCRLLIVESVPRRVKLATNNFTEAEVGNLANRLQELTQCPWRKADKKDSKRPTYWELHLTKEEEIRKFFLWLGPCPVESLARRWPINLPLSGNPPPRRVVKPI